MLMQEAEERVFTSVSNLKTGAGGADNDEDEEDADSKALLRSESLRPGPAPPTLTYLENHTLCCMLYFALTWPIQHKG